MESTTRRFSSADMPLRFAILPGYLLLLLPMAVRDEWRVDGVVNACPCFCPRFLFLASSSVSVVG